MAKQNEGAAREDRHEGRFSSEIRLRASEPEDPRDDDRVTEPAPPPLFEDAGSPWSEYDRAITLSTLPLEDALRDCVDPVAAGHLRQMLYDADALADSLFTLWGDAGSAPPWRTCVRRIYRWAIEVVEHLGETLVASPNDRREIHRAFCRLGAYSALFVQTLIEPSLRDVISDAVHREARNEAKRLRDVMERVGLLDWTITCATFERL